MTGFGFAVLDRLPMGDYPIETLHEVYWVLGRPMKPHVRLS